MIWVDFQPVLIESARTLFEPSEQFGCDIERHVFDAYRYPGADRPNPNAWPDFLANDLAVDGIQYKVLKLVAHK